MSPVLVLVCLEFETLLGERYRFPDVEAETVGYLLRALPLRETNIALTNASGAFLTIPFRIVAKILVNDVVQWSRETPG